MSDKSLLCTGCGHYRPDGAVVDTGDGDGLMWTCPDCVSTSPSGAVGIVLPPPRHECDFPALAHVPKGAVWRCECGLCWRVQTDWSCPYRMHDWFHITRRAYRKAVKKAAQQLPQNEQRVHVCERDGEDCSPDTCGKVPRTPGQNEQEQP